MTEDSHNPFDDAPVIFRYTRAQAIDDGVLVDMTEWARETGFKVPVACTSTVWHGYVQPPADGREWGQSQRGRAHDLLWMLFCAIRRAGHVDTIEFKVIFLMAGRRQATTTFKALCGPGDEGEPVITVMMMTED